eukprot:40075-Pyramimonas_sp.AAC.2
MRNRGCNDYTLNVQQPETMRKIRKRATALGCYELWKHPVLRLLARASQNTHPTEKRGAVQARTCTHWLSRTHSSSPEAKAA